MTNGKPDNTAVRTALWRALHVQVDAKPYVIEDEVGLKLVAPDGDWQERPDMKYTKRLRASIVGRARFVEDLIIEQHEQGVHQYLHFVPVDFEISSWWEQLLKAGFDINKPAVIACTGVSLYLTKEAIIATLNQIATLAPGSKLAMKFY